MSEGGGITINQADIEEVVLTGKVLGCQVFVVGSLGLPEAWEAAQNLVRTFKEATADGTVPKVLVVDVVNAQIRYAKGWRQMKSVKE